AQVRSLFADILSATPLRALPGCGVLGNPRRTAPILAVGTRPTRDQACKGMFARGDSTVRSREGRGPCRGLRGGVADRMSAKRLHGRIHADPPKAPARTPAPPWMRRLTRRRF